MQSGRVDFRIRLWSENCWRWATCWRCRRRVAEPTNCIHSLLVPLLVAWWKCRRQVHGAGLIQNFWVAWLMMRKTPKVCGDAHLACRSPCMNSPCAKALMAVANCLLQIDILILLSHKECISRVSWSITHLNQNCPKSSIRGNPNCVCVCSHSCRSTVLQKRIRRSFSLSLHCCTSPFTAAPLPPLLPRLLGCCLSHFVSGCDLLPLSLRFGLRASLCLCFCHIVSASLSLCLAASVHCCLCD